MCQRCGCRDVIRRGKEAIRQRALDIVNELRLTAVNVDDYEATEIISILIEPFGMRRDEVYEMASWVSGLHQGVRQTDEDRYQDHVRAFRDIFTRLPVRGNPKDIATTYHQLEQLVRELDDDELVSVSDQTRDAILAVKRVHHDMESKVKKLKERYELTSPFERKAKG